MIDFDTQPYAEEVNERVTEALFGHYQGYAVDGVEVRDVHEHNATSHTIAGDCEVQIDGETRTFGFVARIGDMAGFEMLEWGEDVAGCYEPPEPDPMVLIPRIGADSRDWKRWDHARKKPEYQALVRAYNYDAYVAPGGRTRKHYETKARQMGMRWVRQSEVSEIRRSAPKARPLPKKLTRAEKAAIMLEAMGFTAEILGGSR